jgi:hypothetical protein
MILNSNEVFSLIDQQIECESRLTESMEALNDRIAALLKGVGIDGPSEEDLQQLEPLYQSLKRDAAASQRTRVNLLRKLRPGTDASDATIRELALALPSELRGRLEQRRNGVFHRLLDARKTLAANQASLFYSFQFHRKYLLAILQCDEQSNQYSAEGPNLDVPPERLLGRNC